MNLMPAILNNRIHYRKWGIFLACFCLFSCSFNDDTPDVSDMELSLEIHRFDLDIIEADIDHIEDYSLELQAKYGRFFELYTHKIIEIGGINEVNFSDYFLHFLTDYTVNEFMGAVKSVFGDMRKIETELEMAFKFYHYYFPEKEIPEIYTFIAGFNQSVVIDEQLLAIGLDKYLGAGHTLYKYLAVPVYKRNNMHPQKIVSDCMRALALTEFPYHDSVDNVLSRMIHEGKIMYFIDKMLPDEEDSVKVGFSTNQLEWCRKNEKRMWTFFVEEQILFSTDYMQIKRYTDDGPFTPTFSQLSPGRTGVWTGWQIVSSYMKNNPDVTLKQLMRNVNYQQILNQSGYRP